MSGDIKTGGGVNRQVCGNGATRGGSKKSKRNSKHKSKRNNKKTHKSKRNNKSKRNSKHKLKRNNKSKNRKQDNKSKMQKGGDFVSIGSKPAVFSEAFDGPEGVFKYPDDMKLRDFGAKQPNYGVNAI